METYRMCRICRKTTLDMRFQKTNKYNIQVLSLSMNRRKTLGTPENTGFLGSVVADWLQKSVANLLPE